LTPVFQSLFPLPKIQKFYFRAVCIWASLVVEPAAENLAAPSFKELIERKDALAQPAASLLEIALVNRRIENEASA